MRSSRSRIPDAPCWSSPPLETRATQTSYAMRASQPASVASKRAGGERSLRTLVRTLTRTRSAPPPLAVAPVVPLVAVAAAAPAPAVGAPLAHGGAAEGRPSSTMPVPEALRRRRDGGASRVPWFPGLRCRLPGSRPECTAAATKAGSAAPPPALPSAS